MYSRKEPQYQQADGPRAVKAIAPTEQQTANELIAAAMPALLAADMEQQRRLQRALIACRAGGDQASNEQQLRVAFQLYEEELLTRGDICELFAIDVRQFIDYAAAFAPDHE
jgi:hypothetical protein